MDLFNYVAKLLSEVSTTLRPTLHLDSLTQDESLIKNTKNQLSKHNLHTKTIHSYQLRPTLKNVTFLFIHGINIKPSSIT